MKTIFQNSKKISGVEEGNGHDRNMYVVYDFLTSSHRTNIQINKTETRKWQETMPIGILSLP